ncbi:MAG: hypothetical protein MI740_10470 [Halanaerobiales bacterium]|nr:hypothetical protein [Halanaerobiales bacterium]
MLRVILNTKVKYKDKTYPVNSKGVTEPIPATKKDVKFFQDRNMIVDVMDEKGQKMYLDKKDETINELKKELIQKDETIAAMREKINRLGEVYEQEKNNSSTSGEEQSVDNSSGKIDPLEEKSLEELFVMAGELKIQGRSKIRTDKEKLIKAIKVAQAGQ